MTNSAIPCTLLQAGEVREADVLTSLTDKTKHVIQVGDHKQLRPKAEAYNLTVEARRGYDHNVSQFERLVTGEQPLPSVCLKVQHRMRPEISQLIRACTYPELQDHESVLNRPHLKGLKSGCSVVFINHTEPEEGERRVTGSSTAAAAAAAAAAVVDSAVPQQSKVNLHEVAMVVDTSTCYSRAMILHS
jgi:AAA domain